MLINREDLNLLTIKMELVQIQKGFLDVDMDMVHTKENLLLGKLLQELMKFFLIQIHLSVP